MKKRAAGCLFSYRFIYMLYGEYQCVPSTSCAPCWCRRSAMRWMTGQRVPSLRDAVSLLIAAVAAEEGLQKQLLFPVLRKGSGALVKGF